MNDNVKRWLTFAEETCDACVTIASNVLERVKYLCK